MSVGRFAATGATALAVAGVAAVAVAMVRPQGAPKDIAAPLDPAPAATSTANPGVPYLPPRTADSAGAHTTSTGPAADRARTAAGPAPAQTVSTTTASPAATATRTSPTEVRTSAVTRTATATPTRAATTQATPRAAATPHVAATVGRALPLHYTTGSATQVITVTARSYGSTVATLQAWSKTRSGGWVRYGTSVTAHIGSDGMSTSPSETRSATPIGSFTLTQAFGHDSDPGTALPYLHTTPADWWISQAGPLYNTHQHCSSHCAFRLGSPNEHLYYETPYYNYAVVIDYNTRNSPTGVRPGKGSAFFLHVTDGTPTAGCVAIPQAKLISIMRWLTPGRHPRILIGLT